MVGNQLDQFKSGYEPPLVIQAEFLADWNTLEADLQLSGVSL